MTRALHPRHLDALVMACVASQVGAGQAQPSWQTPGEAEAAEARALAAGGRCREAIDAFDRAILRRSADASLRRDRGLCHEQLGHVRPALDDYGAYLSMVSDAPDAGRIAARLEALRTAQEPVPEEHEVYGVEDPIAAAPASPPAASAGDETDGSAEAAPPSEWLPRRGWLLGPHLGWRTWNDSGFAEATISVGAEGALLYQRRAEIQLRAVRLDTRNQAKGFGLSAAHAFRLPLDTGNRWELLLALGGGFERQTTRMRNTRDYYHGRLTPSVRWAMHPSVLLQAGLEAGVGAIPPPPEIAALEDSPTVMAHYLGLRGEIVWEIATE